MVEPERMVDRFGEMALEANQSNREFHVFYDREAAEAWLIAD